MGITPHEVPVTRDDVRSWITLAKKQKRDTREVITEQINKRGLEGAEVNTVGNDSLSDTTDLVDHIMMDIDSYSNYTGEYDASS